MAELTHVAMHPVLLAMIGTQADLGFWLAQLDQVANLSDVSELEPAGRPNEFRVYATLSRRTPIFGGGK